MEAVDAVLEAVLAKDAAALESLFRLTEAACTHAEGSGGPPKCGAYPGPPAEGTVVQAFPMSTCEGEWHADVAPIVQNLLERELGFYGVLELNLDAPLAGLDYYPQPEYGLVLQHEVNGEFGGILLGVEQDGGVSYLQYVCFAPPTWFLSEQAQVVYGDNVEVIFEGPAFR